MAKNELNLNHFITIEGIEGAGKTTAISFLKSYFQKNHQVAVFTREPGGTPLAETLRNLLLSPLESEQMEGKSELLLMFAARAQHIAQLIKPTLTANQWVICDRYIDASYAYQGWGRGLDEQFIAALDAQIVGDIYPGLTLLLDLPVSVGLERTKQRSLEKDRIEQEQTIFFERVREGYLHRAKCYPERIKIIDASLPPEAVTKQILNYLPDLKA